MAKQLTTQPPQAPQPSSKDDAYLLKTAAELNKATRKQVVWSVAWLLFIYLWSAVASVGPWWYLTKDAERTIEHVGALIQKERNDGKDINTAVDQVVKSYYGDSDESLKEARARCKRLALAVAVTQEAMQNGADPANHPTPKNQASLTRGLMVQSVFYWIAHMFVLAIYHFLLGASLIRARSEIEHRKEDRPLAEMFFASLEDEFRCRRNVRLLMVEERGLRFFGRTAAFSIFIGQASLYFFAPLGMYTSLLELYARFKAPPGMLSSPPYYSSVADTPSVIVGLSGFMLYSAVHILRHYISRDLSSKMLTPLVNRGIVVVILSSIIGSLFKDNMIPVVFLIGIFPQTGVDAAARMAQSTVERFLDDTGTGLSKISELDLAKQKVLQDEGIINVHDLAYANLGQLLEKVGIAPRVLLSAVDRAMLIDVVGPKLADDLLKYPITTASEFLAVAREKPEPSDPNSPAKTRLDEVAELVGVKNLEPMATRLATNPNVKIIDGLREKYRSTQLSTEILTVTS